MLAVACGSAAAGVYVYNSRLKPAPDPAAQLARLNLPDADGRQVDLARWQGKILVVNFWATWCAPCREEMPVLVRAQQKYAGNGVQLVGIAIDSADKVRQFGSELSVNYPLVLGGMAALELTQRLGNKAGVLPYTLILDRAGRTVLSHLGPITEPELDQAIARAL
jgi:thiol-disulfide isomerase/thioredoxin